ARGRVLTEVDDHVPHSAARAADDLDLGVRRILPVHAAERAAHPVERRVRLGDPGGEAVLGHLVGAPGAGEEAPGGLQPVEVDDPRPREVRGGEPHAPGLTTSPRPRPRRPGGTATTGASAPARARTRRAPGRRARWPRSAWPGRRRP